MSQSCGSRRLELCNPATFARDGDCLQASPSPHLPKDGLARHGSKGVVPCSCPSSARQGWQHTHTELGFIDSESTRYQLCEPVLLLTAALKPSQSIPLSCGILPTIVSHFIVSRFFPSDWKRWSAWISSLFLETHQNATKTDATAVTLQSQSWNFLVVS